MRDYGKIAPYFWTRGSGKRLRGDALAQSVASYLCTGPTANMIGLYHIAIPTIAHETGHPADDVREALRRIEKAGFAFYDEDHEIVFIPNGAREQVGDRLKATDKRVVGIAKELRAVGDHRFAAQFLDIYAGAFCLDVEGVAERQEAPSGRAEAPPARAPDSAPAPALVSDQGGVGGDGIATPLPSDFVLTPERRAYAELVPLTDIDGVFKKFGQVCRERQKVSGDWDSSWQKFCDYEAKIQRGERDKATRAPAGRPPPREPPKYQPVPSIRRPAVHRPPDEAESGTMPVAPPFIPKTSGR